MLRNKKVLIGVTASIAAYKVASLVRLFKKSGCLVKVIQTKKSLEFITPLTLSTLSEEPVLFEMQTNQEWNNHVDLASWADFIVIAPATANTIAKMATGQSDNLLLATYLSAKCQVYFAPAMDLDMHQHPSTKENIEKIQSFGTKLIPAEFGELASGLVGEGRMADPESILKFINKDLSNNLPFKKKKILITAGPTYEPIDKVRFIGNRSSGRMGIALAECAAQNGAKVDLILGPSALNTLHSGITTHKVNTSLEMYKKTSDLFDNSHISIFTAAVSDYTPKKVLKYKMKKTNQNHTINLERTKDILSEMSVKKKKNQFIVGFALETENEIENARKKLKNKNIDMIVLNSLRDEGAGFDHSTNKVTFLDQENNINTFKLKSKTEVAKDIIERILEKTQ